VITSVHRGLSLLYRWVRSHFGSYTTDDEYYGNIPGDDVGGDGGDDDDNLDDHLPCFDHTLQLAVKDAIVSTPELLDLLSQVRSISLFVRGRDEARSELEKQGGTMLELDVPTRWNSTFYVLQKFRLNYEQMANVAKYYQEKYGDALVTADVTNFPTAREFDVMVCGVSTADSHNPNR